MNLYTLELPEGVTVPDGDIGAFLFVGDPPQSVLVRLRKHPITQAAQTGRVEVDERKEFERHSEKAGFSNRRNHLEDEYALPETQRNWETWMARARLQPGGEEGSK